MIGMSVLGLLVFGVLGITLNPDESSTGWITKTAAQLVR
jgi:hypothetical protein